MLLWHGMCEKISQLYGLDSTLVVFALITINPTIFSLFSLILFSLRLGNNLALYQTRFGTNPVANSQFHWFPSRNVRNPQWHRDTILSSFQSRRTFASIGESRMEMVVHPSSTIRNELPTLRMMPILEGITAAMMAMITRTIVT